MLWSYWKPLDYMSQNNWNLILQIVSATHVLSLEVTFLPFLTAFNATRKKQGYLCLFCCLNKYRYKYWRLCMSRDTSTNIILLKKMMVNTFALYDSHWTLLYMRTVRYLVSIQDQLGSSDLDIRYSWQHCCEYLFPLMKNYMCRQELISLCANRLHKDSSAGPHMD